MNVKRLTTALMFICLFSITAIAAMSNLCEDRVDSNVSCTIVTPVIKCSDNATIYFANSTSYEESMSLMSNNIYNFTFNQSNTETYTIRLCDNSTTYIAVRTTLDKKISLSDVGIIGLFIALTSICFWVSFNQEDRWLKLLFLMMGFVFIPLTTAVGLGMAKEYGLSAGMQLILERTFILLLIVAAIVVAYCALALLVELLRYVADLKDRKNRGG